MHRHTRREVLPLLCGLAAPAGAQSLPYDLVVKGGRVIGKSDEIGAYPVERPVNPAEVVATIYRSLGLELETELPGPSGRPFPLVNFGTHEIKELFA